MKGLTSLRRFKFALPGNSHVHPIRDWFIVLGITAVGLGISVGWNALNYVRALQTMEQHASPAERPVFDTKAVEGVRAAFETRAQEVIRYTSEYTFVDPSR